MKQNPPKATISRGTVRSTKYQEKKHVSQMTKREKKYLAQAVIQLRCRRMKISQHLRHKKDDYPLSAIEELFYLESPLACLVEYNETLTQNGLLDKRVLLRATNAFPIQVDGKTSMGQLCLVISLTRARFVTAYWNFADDTHSQLNWTRYNQHLQIIDY